MAESSKPVPKPPPPVQRWFQERRSEYPWEQDGLDHVAGLMPKVEPYRAWATFSFTAASGRVNECDLFIATPGGLYLVELKGHPGRVVNNGGDWIFHGPDRARHLHNPLHLTDRKSKELRSRLSWAAGKLHLTGVKVPRVEPAVFLTDPNLVSELDEVQRARVYGRDDVDTGLGRIWADLLGVPPHKESLRVSPNFSRQLPKLLEAIGITSSQAHLNFGDGWKLAPQVLDSGPTWEDRLAERKQIVSEAGRVRIYLVSQMATDESRRSVDRAARREYQVLQGINHRGIAQAVQIGEHQGGPAILFRHAPGDLPLQSYLNVYGGSLTSEVRLDLVRQLAEAVRYAHNRSLYHRALAARSVYVTAKEDGSQPVLRIVDWQTAARDFDTATPKSIGNSLADDTHLEDSALVYLAPEFEMPYADPVDLDVFGMGAISYLILTGEPPAPDRPTLIERVSAADGGLHPYAVASGLTDELDRLVFQATRGATGDRLESAGRFLEILDQIEQDSAVPDEAADQDWAGTDPLTAVPGQAVDGDVDGVWRVERVLGSGGTARAFLVARTVEDDNGEERTEQRVLKVALDETKAPQLHAEAVALGKVGGGAIVRLLGGPRQLGDRTVLDLEFAGERTLARVLKDDGKLTYHQLERYGRDLFRALDQLAAKGVRHRDLKPDNFGVLRRADRTWELKLLDFSHSGVSDRDATAGTRGYLDPFLGTHSRPDFDDHAERYAAAVTLHEMASGEKPRWGDEKTDPRTTSDPTPYLAADLFDPALREGLTAFFSRALNRDVNERFDTFGRMEDAWREVFSKADQAPPVTTQVTATGDEADTILDTEALQAARDVAAEAATLETPLQAAGLSPRAASVAAGFGATTVGGLLGVPLYQIAKARGAGAVARKELNRRHKQWTAKFGSPDQQGDQPVAGQGTDGQDAPLPMVGRVRIDELASLLIPTASAKNSRKAKVLRLLLNLPGEDGALPEVPEQWPTQAQVAKSVQNITQTTVSRYYKDAVTEWAQADWMEPVRKEVVERTRAFGGIASVSELAAELRVRHGAGDRLDDQTVMVLASAVVRAAVEAEMYTGPGRDEEDEPKLARLRRGPQVLVALESLPGTDDPAPGELADYAVALGGLARELAGQDPLPGRGEVLRELRRIAPPEGMSPLSDVRLVGLAAAVVPGILVSPGMQVYPRDLKLAKALRLAQAGAGVRHPQGITLEGLRTKVEAWFPGLDAYGPGLTWVEMEEALAAAGFPLKYEAREQRFLPPAPVPHPTTSTTATNLTPGTGGSDPVRQDKVATRLGVAAKRGGFLALTVNLKKLPGMAGAIAANYPVVPVDVAEVFLTEFRALAAEHKAEWGQVLRADEKLTRTGQMPGGLRSFVTRVMERVEQCLLERADGPRTVLFLHNAGLLARYFEHGGHELLTRLQNAARRSADVPHGVWLLCPSEAPRARPNLDGKTVEVIGGDAEWIVLDKAFVERLHESRAA
ncbi:BREX system serine/threonine kinase PglW [Actinomadura hibisca]|uniref:BREX system serine/threonine kinase PglW n=1 Tax=Actinomadura hibisca TaxID=68565 RepID=UPI00082DE3A8|nr:BREX system serine/threonine kinase PglW [Actinomadura hibisca]